MKKTEVQKIIAESLVKALNESLEEDLNKDAEYNRGYQAGVKARVYGRVMDDEQLKSHYPPSFIKGYKRALYGNWWDRFNQRMTDFLGNMGYGRTRGL